MPGATWWVNLRRAEKHLKELEIAWHRARNRARPNKVSCDVETDDIGHWFMIRADLLHMVDDDFSAIVGDFVGNLRAALDHICVAVTQNDDAYFPIITPDVWHPGTHTSKETEQRKRFDQLTKHLPTGAIEDLMSVQPYRSSPQPQHHPLTIVQTLSNADKHRTLTALAQYTYNPSTTIRHRKSSTFPDDFVKVVRREDFTFADGGIVATDGPFDLHRPPPPLPRVKSKGGIEIGLKASFADTWDYGMPGSALMIRDVVRIVLETLEPHVPS